MSKKGKQAQTRATAALVVSSQKNPLFVFSSADGAIAKAEDSVAELTKASYGLYCCQDCNAKFVSAVKANFDPFCVVCGSMDTKKETNVKSSTELLSGMNDSSFKAVECGNCSVDNILMAGTVDSGHALHCSACGEPILKAQDESMDLSDEDDLILEDEDDVLDELEDDVENAVLDETVEDAPVDEESPDIDMGEVVTEVEEENELSGDEQTLVDDSLMEASSDDDFKVDTEMDFGDDMAASYNIGDPMMDVLAMADDANSFTLMSTTQSKNVWAMKNGVPIAVLQASKAPESVADRIHTTGFSRIVARLAEEKGMRAALKEMKFEPICVNIRSQASFDKEMKANLDLKAAEQAKAISEMQESLVLAAETLGANVVRDETNEMITAVAAVLKAANVRNADSLARRTVAEASGAFTQQLIRVASTFQEKGASYRKLYADVLNSTDVARITASTEDDPDPFSEPFEEALDDLQDVVSKQITANTRRGLMDGLFPESA